MILVSLTHFPLDREMKKWILTMGTSLCHCIIRHGRSMQHAPNRCEPKQMCTSHLAGPSTCQTAEHSQHVSDSIGRSQLRPTLWMLSVSHISFSADGFAQGWSLSIDPGLVKMEAKEAQEPLQEVVVQRALGALWHSALS